METADTQVMETPAIVTNDPSKMFGTGRYSNVAKELFADSKRLLGLTPEQAERLAKAYVADLGRINAKVSEVGISKPNKDMHVTLRETSKTKGVVLTNAITLAKLCVMLQEAKVFGVEQYNKITLRPELIEWLNKE